MTPEELQIAKLRYLLYEAIVELEYVQASEDHSLCASAKGREIVERGMKLLEVKDLSQEHLVGKTAPPPYEPAFGDPSFWPVLLSHVMGGSIRQLASAEKMVRAQVECTAPAPQPATDSDWQWWFDLTAEGRLSMIRRFRAGIPQVTPTRKILASLKEFLSLRQACIDVGGTEGPLDQELITRLAEMQIGVVDRAQAAIAEFERQSSEQASPTPDQCPQCGSVAFWSSLPPCHGLEQRHSWHSSAGTPKGTK